MAYAIKAFNLAESCGRIYPYFHEWKMTPIEENVWSDIRKFSVPLYPQVPVGQYFVDFGNPWEKVAIEVDGKEWHMNKEKDDKRQKEIESMGWAVYRIPGKDTYTPPLDNWVCPNTLNYESEDYHENCDCYPVSKSEEIVYEINRRHFNYGENLGESMSELLHLPCKTCVDPFIDFSCKRLKHIMQVLDDLKWKKYKPNEIDIYHLSDEVRRIRKWIKEEIKEIHI